MYEFSHVYSISDRHRHGHTRAPGNRIEMKGRRKPCARMARCQSRTAGQACQAEKLLCNSFLYQKHIARCAGERPARDAAQHDSGDGVPSLDAKGNKVRPPGSGQSNQRRRGIAANRADLRRQRQGGLCRAQLHVGCPCPGLMIAIGLDLRDACFQHGLLERKRNFENVNQFEHRLRSYVLSSLRGGARYQREVDCSDHMTIWLDGRALYDDDRTFAAAHHLISGRSENPFAQVSRLAGTKDHQIGCANVDHAVDRHISFYRAPPRFPYEPLHRQPFAPKPRRPQQSALWRSLLHSPETQNEDRRQAGFRSHERE